MATLVSNMVGDTTNGAKASANRKAKGSRAATAARIKSNIAASERARGSRDGAMWRNDDRNARNAQARTDRNNRIRSNIRDTAYTRGVRDVKTNYNPSL